MGIKLSIAAKVNWTKTELFRLTFAEQIAESKVRTQRNAQRKFSLSDWLSPNQKRHFTFWIKFGLSLKFGLSERLIQKVKSPSVPQRERTASVASSHACSANEMLLSFTVYGYELCSYCYRL